MENYYLDRILEKLDTIEEKVNDISIQVEVSKVKFQDLEERLTETEADLKRIDKLPIRALNWVFLGVLGAIISLVVTKVVG